VDEGAAGIDHVGDVTAALVGGGDDQRVFEPADQLCGVVAVQQRRADAVAAHRADAVGQQEPAGVGLDGRAAIADLHELPWELRLLDHLGLVPDQDVVLM